MKTLLAPMQQKLKDVQKGLQDTLFSTVLAESGGVEAQNLAFLASTLSVQEPCVKMLVQGAIPTTDHQHDNCPVGCS